tara:strand:- start:36489 stop:36707 length:219 start_codon:yes stop_codon:yes gene_type:complete
MIRLLAERTHDEDRCVFFLERWQATAENSATLFLGRVTACATKLVVKYDSRTLLTENSGKACSTFFPQSAVQ